MNVIKDFTIISIFSLIFFLLVDFFITNYLDIRGFSKFYESKFPIGYINKKKFSGQYGGFLDQFYTLIEIDDYGNRVSTPCSEKNINTLIIGDSITAGFEVDKDKTFISLINQNCKENNLHAINGGVRGHDTNQVIANYLRIRKLF